MTPDLIERLKAKGQPRRPNGAYTVCGQLQGHAYIANDPDCAAAAVEIERLRARIGGMEADSTVKEYHRLRGAALALIGDKDAWGKWHWDGAPLLHLSSYTDDAWRPIEEITDAIDGQWFVWRDPASTQTDMHADRAIVEDGKIVGKDGCGLLWYVECQPCRFADDVVEALKGVGQWPEDAP